ncbi:MAG: hypothetical protein WCI20_15210 [bacterium]
MERYGWTLTRHSDGLDRYGYLEENDLFKEISFAQIVDYCKRNLSMADVAACSSILPLSDELYEGYPPDNHPAGDLRLESQNVEASGGALPSTRVPLNGLTSKRSPSLPSVWGVCRRSLESAPPVVTSKCTTSDAVFLVHFLAGCKRWFGRCLKAAEPRFSAAG